jgi:hypothetical protein
MLQPDVYWLHEIEGVRLAIMPRPRSGEWLADEIAGYQRLGVQTIVSLLESNEVRDLTSSMKGPSVGRPTCNSFPFRLQIEAFRVIASNSRSLSNRLRFVCGLNIPLPFTVAPASGGPVWWQPAC